MPWARVHCSPWERTVSSVIVYNSLTSVRVTREQCTHHVIMRSINQCHRVLPSRVGFCLYVVYLPVSHGTLLKGVAFVWSTDQCHRVLPSRVLPLFGAWTNVTGYSLPGCCPHVVHNLPVSQGTPLQSAASVWCINLCHRVLPSRASSAS